MVLYDASLTELWAIPVQFDLLSAFNGAPSAVLVTTDDSLASVSAVPEPSSLLLMLLAALAAGVTCDGGACRHGKCCLGHICMKTTVCPIFKTAALPGRRLPE
ncbi:PEP-CTERM sorting domain-containing protein [Massilia sp. H-1]|nr:PEP-CTERM sorting domain-containing protein [Massilia sp. H-1]